jgi:hypothetical protein
MAMDFAVTESRVPLVISGALEFSALIPQEVPQPGIKLRASTTAPLAPTTACHYFPAIRRGNAVQVGRSSSP